VSALEGGGQDIKSEISDDVFFRSVSPILPGLFARLFTLCLGSRL